MVEPMDLTKEDAEMLQARDYQEEILDRALKQNVIIYLPTGSGKTFIAVMAIKRMSKDLAKPLREGGKRTVFVTNTVALAKQQCTVLQKQTNLKVNVYTGDRNVDYWGRDRWDVEFEQTQVIVATCQIIVDIITSGIIKLSDFNLLIFDECHNGTNKHPMHSLMGFFRYVPEKDHPRVIGLTGILMKTPTINTVIQELTNLEATFRSVIVTVSNLEKFKNVLVYSTKPNEVIIPYDNSRRITTSIEDKITIIVEQTKKFALNWRGDETDFKKTKNLNDQLCADPVKHAINRLNDYLYQVNDLGPFGASIAVMTLIISLELRKRSAQTLNMRCLYRMCISMGDRIKHLLSEFLYDDDDEDEKEIDVIMSNSSPKVQMLLNYLKKEFSGKDPSDISCLVFVQRRTSAKNLYHIVKRFALGSENLPLKPSFMVGRNTSLTEPITAILTDKWSDTAINEFKKGDSNFLVASSVLEEGIDVQSCNHVIRYDSVDTFRSYTQTKGRARSQESTFGIIVGLLDHSKVIKRISEYREIEKELRTFLIEKAIDRKKPLTEDILKQFPVDVPPFKTSKGATLEAHAAMNLLNRYCMSLPGDCFTMFKPKWEKLEYVQTHFTKIVAKVSLPPQSTIKEPISSDPMRNVYLAKIHAAFKACVQLYHNGELNDNLLPITPKISNQITDNLYFLHWQEFNEDNPKTAGTKKNKRIHDVVYPSELCSAMPEVGKDFFLYAINVQPDFEVDEENADIKRLLEMPPQYAIATKKPLPKLAAMPIFMTQGRLKVKISDTPKVAQISTSEELKKLTRFHVMLFRDILHSWKNYFALNTRDEENSFLIVPTMNGADINWNLIEKFQNMSSSREVSEIQRSRMKYEPSDYENSVISTWYSSDNQIRYGVNRCRLDLTPLSPFPNDAFKSFAAYFNDKYKVSVIKNDQFLIEARPFTSRMNFITPGSGESGKAKKRKIVNILLIPELCHNFKYPADMWLKALFLPTILHRIRYMLLAEKLRNDLNAFLNVNFPNYSPADLIVDATLKRFENDKVLKDVQAPLFPDPKGTVPKPMKEVKSFLDQNKYGWKEYEEPCQVDKLMDKIYKIELDYYHQFITNKLNEMSLMENEQSLPAIAINPEDRPAICDVPFDEKLAIKILDISAETMRSPEQWEILSAITAASANDVFDSERMELLGDSFLKFSISLFLLRKHPTWNEGILSEVKGRFVSNRNLLYHSIKLKLPGMLNVNAFKPRDDWQPPLVAVPNNVKTILIRENINPSVLFELKMDPEEIESGVCKQQTLTDFQTYFRVEDNVYTLESQMHPLIGRNVVSDKTCADSVESLLGVCVQSYGICKTFPILNFMGIINSTDKLENFLDLDMGNPRLKPSVTDSDINDLLINCDELEENIGYKFRDRAYLLQALTHPSYPTNRLTGCYQQLEFIGDAVLDFLTSCYIFERCKNMGPGELTDLRSALVNNVTLACLSVRYKLHHFMLSQNASLLQAITKFADFQKTQKLKVTDQCRILISEDGNVPPMADMIEVPKALGDIFEAVIGAVFLDTKNDLKKTWAFIYRLMHREIQEFMLEVPKQVVRMLEEHHGASPSWSDPVVDDDIVMVTCTFTCRNEIRQADGYGANSATAKAAAAKLALQCLKQS